MEISVQRSNSKFDYTLALNALVRFKLCDRLEAENSLADITLDDESVVFSNLERRLAATVIFELRRAGLIVTHEDDQGIEPG